MPPEDRREQILRVAMDHFSHRGYDRAAMSQIAADAGVTRALVYHYYSGKEALLEAVLRREADKLLASTEPAPDASPRDNLMRALGAYLDHFAASEGKLRELYTPHPLAPAVVWEIAAANHEVQIARLRSSLDLDDSPRNRLALGAWLAFVEEAARTSPATGLGKDTVIDLCLAALQAATGVPLGRNQERTEEENTP